MDSFRTVVQHSPMTSVHPIAFFAMNLVTSDVVRVRQQPEPDVDRPAVPDVPEPSPSPDRRKDRKDKILPDVGPHGPGQGEPVAPVNEPNTHGSGGGEP